MKKNYFKKSLSLIMAVLMLMSCWVFVAPQKAEAALAYGMSAVNGSSEQNSSIYVRNTGSSGDYLLVQYPSVMYLDKSESLTEVGYTLNMSTNFGSNSEYTLYIYNPLWGGQSHGNTGNNYNTSTGLKGQTALVDNFTGYGLASASPGSWANETIDGGGNTLIQVGNPKNNLSGNNFAFSGTPKNTGEFVYDLSKNTGDALLAKFRRYKYYERYNNPTYDNASSTYLTGNVKITIHVYDKSALNTAVTNANTYYTNNSSYSGYAATWNTFVSARSTASTLLTNRKVTHAEVTSGTTAIQNANNALVFAASNAALKTAVANAKAIQAKPGYATLYTEASKTALADAINTAEKHTLYTDGVTSYYAKDHTGSGSNSAGAKAAAEQTTINNLISGINTAINGLKRKYDIGYGNLFSLADWAVSTSATCGGGTLTVDVEEGVITVTDDSSVSGTDTYTNHGANNMYVVKVKANTEYVLQYVGEGEGNSIRPLIFDTNATLNGFDTVIKDVGTSAGKQTITFTSPNNDVDASGYTYIHFRFGVNGISGGTATYKDIALYEKTVYDQYGKYNTTVRVPFFVGDTDELKYTPRRDGYRFYDWVDKNGNSVGSVSAFSSSDTVYATWVKEIKVYYKNANGNNFDTLTIEPPFALTSIPDDASKLPDINGSYKFLGWFIEGTDTKVEVGTVINSDNDITISPRFETVEHDPAKYVYSELLPATCMSNAYVKISCGTCGYTIVDRELYNNGNKGEIAAYNKYAHSFTMTPVLDENNTAQHLVYCSYGCGTYEAKAHDYKDFGSLEDGTCSEKETLVKICTCGARIDQKGEYYPDVHDFNYFVGTPIGNDQHTVACRDNPNHTEVVACTDKGKAKDCKCDVCGQELTHTYNKKIKREDYIASVAECGKNATYYYLCQCGKVGSTTWEDEGSALTHEWTETETHLASAAACEVNETYYYECSLCRISSENSDKEEKTWEKTDTALAHKFDGAVVCKNDGTHSYTCSLCNNADGVDGVKGATTACTYGDWTDAGDDSHAKTCTECGFEVSKGHNWTAWASTDPDKKADGQHTRTCKNCNKVETLACSYTDKAISESCLVDGYTTHTCNDCGHYYETAGTAHPGHDYTGSARINDDGTHSYLCKHGCNTYGYNGVEKNSAPCEYRYDKNETDGRHNAVCTVCGYTKAERCSGGEATCAAPATCDKCNDSYGSKSDHIYSGAIVTFDDGTHAYRCKYCVDNNTIYGVGSEANKKENCSFTGDVVTLDGDVHAYRCVTCKNENTYGVGAKYNETEACSGGTATCIDYTVCDICKDTHGELDSNAHSFGAWVNNNDGTHSRTCTRGCTFTNRVETVDCTKENATAVVTPATCKEDGYTTYTCNVCTYSWDVKDTGSALGHDWSAWVDNNNGTHTRTCKRGCSYSDNTETANCADNAEVVVTPPTCTAQGYTTYICKDCGHTWEDDVKTPVKDHTFGTKRDTAEFKRSDRDCTTALTYWYLCSDCDISAEKVKEDAKYAGVELYWTKEEAKGHTFTAEVVADDYLVVGSVATCTTKAVYYKSCKDCGLSSKDIEGAEAKFESGIVLGHKWVKPAADKLVDFKATNADCTKDATYYFTCERCHISSKDLMSATWAEADSKTGHDFDYEGAYTAYVAPDCDDAGRKAHYTCKVCHKKFVDNQGETEITNTVISATGHKWVGVAYKAATCEEDGYTKHRECSVCHDKLNYTKYDKLGHEYDAKYGYSCDKDNNYHAYGCKNGCGTYGVGAEKYTVVLDEVTNKVVEIKGGVACGFSGAYVQYDNEGVPSHKKVCVCGSEKSEACADATPEVVAPTCAAEGYTQHICDKCSHEWKTDYTDKAAHNYDYEGAAWEIADGDVHIMKCENYANCKEYKEEACYTDDNGAASSPCGQQKTCKVCKDKFGESAQHQWIEKVDSKYLKTAANCDSPAVYYVSCSVCFEKHATVTFTHGDKRAHEMSDYLYTIKDWKFAPNDFDASQLKAPTCGEEGKSISYCANCSYYKLKTEISDNKAHNWKYKLQYDANDELTYNNWEVVGGDCGSGVTKKNICLDCGETMTKTVSVPHAWEAKFIKEASCTDNGYIEFTCTTCQAAKMLSGKNKADFVLDGVDYAAKYPKVIAAGKHTWIDKAPEGAACMVVDGNLVFVDKYPAYDAEGRGYLKCSKCTVTEKVVIPAYGNDPKDHKHPELGAAGENTLKTVAMVKPTCSSSGHLEYVECTRCSYSQYMIDHDAYYLAPLGHSDSNKDSKCDDCGKKLSGDKTDNCTCMCHKENGFMKFIYKIVSLFWKLFKTNKSCACGNTHY